MVKYDEDAEAWVKVKKETAGSDTVERRVMPKHDYEPEHMENENCWCNPTFDGLANKWNHNHLKSRKSRAILTHSAHG